VKPSTTDFISYDLRPAKQTERRILLDFLKCANECGMTISDCRYVGMGGTAFYDFHLMHRFLGVNRMTSLERFCHKNQAKGLSKRMKADLPFLLKAPPYKIRNPNLTERERVVFDLAVTKRRSNSKQSNALKKLGFKRRDFDAYRDLIRFLPRYHESII